MADVEFKDYTMQVKAELEKRVNATLREMAGEVISQTMRNSRVGQAAAPTKNSFKYRVDDTTHTAFMGSDQQNAIWEEFGTGEYALKGNGRKGAWYVPVDKVIGYKRPSFNGKVVVVHGKEGKKYYKTNGKKPSRAFWKAYSGLKNKIIKRFQSVLKGL